VVQKLRQQLEQQQRDGKISNPITLEESLQMPYLWVKATLWKMHPSTGLTWPQLSRQAVIKEATRLHPGVGLPLERYVPPEGATLCGVALAAGTNVSMMAPVVQIDPDVFGEDAQVFRPERWLESDPAQMKLVERSMLVVSIVYLLIAGCSVKDG
jgi:cytochrome P450